MQDTLCVGALTVVCAALTTVLALTTALAHQSLLIVFMDARPTFAVRAPYYLPYQRRSPKTGAPRYKGNAVYFFIETA